MVAVSKVKDDRICQLDGCDQPVPEDEVSKGGKYCSRVHAIKAANQRAVKRRRNGAARRRDAAVDSENGRVARVIRRDLEARLAAPMVVKNVKDLDRAEAARYGFAA